MSRRMSKMWKYRLSILIIVLSGLCIKGYIKMCLNDVENKQRFHCGYNVHAYAYVNNDQ